MSNLELGGIGLRPTDAGTNLRSSFYTGKARCDRNHKSRKAFNTEFTEDAEEYRWRTQRDVRCVGATYRGCPTLVAFCATGWACEPSAARPARLWKNPKTRDSNSRAATAIAPQ